MNRKFIVAIGIGFVILLIVLFFTFRNEDANQVQQRTPIPKQQPSIQPNEESRLSDEDAEEVGYNFILNFIQSAPPQPDPQAQQAAYEALSESAKESVSEDTISRDLAAFVGVQDVPDQGASVEDLQLGEEEAILIVGLNFSGGQALRAIHLIPEEGVWKVDNIEALQEYPTGEEE